MEYVITGIENINNVHRYIIKKDINIHNVFCNLLSELDFEEDSISKVDIIFDDLDNEFIYISNNKLDIYFFITKNYINLVIKTSIAQEELNTLIGKHFSFPK
jgi:hypothetical protein